MKNILFTSLFLLSFIFTAQSQLNFGLKGGVNYDFSGDINNLGTSIESSADDVKHGSDNKMGYHVGVWFKTEFLNLFLRPELVYTQIEKEYTSLSSETINIKKIDIPVVFGTKILGPVYIFGGPSFQYILENDFSVSNTKINAEDFSVGLNLGTGVELGNFGLEVRWEKGITQDDKAKIQEYNTGNFEIDNRPNQLIFSVNFKLN